MISLFLCAAVLRRPLFQRIADVKCGNRIENSESVTSSVLLEGRAGNIRNCWPLARLHVLCKGLLSPERYPQDDHFVKLLDSI